jgi:hypothetical protein
MHPDRATALLAVVRIIAVLGMSFCIAFGLFLLLGWWPLPAAISLLCSIPFFVLMRVMEKRALKDAASTADEPAPETK